MTGPITMGSGAERAFGPITRQMLVRYSGASGDFNPMHYDDGFARGAGFPSVFAQGMLTAGLLGTFASEWLGPHNIRGLKVRFKEQVWPDDVLTFAGRVVAMSESDEGPLATVEVTCTRQTGATALSGTVRCIVPETTDGAP
ncbi:MULTISPECIES: MaoC/PaaZ C-terminal domain-containing protein [Arsenicicoccus]|uniref:MaoC/PaaZ C-terminal domain-containing protein n=1 Tax=Arsenicicoccus TaxID=267408 RepID=UPI002579BCC2|nr:MULTISPECIES: MaoC/PaaZ C-terminal domain-containing protein [Actinomycetes]